MDARTAQVATLDRLLRPHIMDIPRHHPPLHTLGIHLLQDHGHLPLPHTALYLLQDPFHIPQAVLRRLMDRHQLHYPPPPLGSRLILAHRCIPLA